MRGLLRLLRPNQWIKSGFVLAPLLFSAKFVQPDAAIEALVATLMFSLMASATYIINDLHDIESDRSHPIKSRTRPLASGEVTPGQAGFALLAILALLAIGALYQPGVALVLLAYLALNLSYTFWLKQQPVVDIFVISMGFVLRVYAGAVAIEVQVSAWMFVTTLCLALYLAAIKRRQELITWGSDAREVLKLYSVSLVDRYAAIASTGALLFYSLYVVTEHPDMVFTIPFVLFGLFRYWFLVETRQGGESPTDLLLSDWQLLLTAAVWVVACAWTLAP